MAGAGYKLFNTGDVLTAAQVNTYLQEQVIMVFASATARTTALSGVLAEGMASYLKDTDSFEVYNGTSWVSASGDLTALTAGTGISISSSTGPVPTVTNSMATEITASGDIIVGTGSGTFDNLPIGTTGQVLTADTTVSPYKVKWATTTGGGMTLLSTTTLSGTSTSISVSPSGYNDLVLYVVGATAAADFDVRMTINNDTTASNYRTGFQASLGYGAATGQSISDTGSVIFLCPGNNSAKANDTQNSARILIGNPNSAKAKNIQTVSAWYNNSNHNSSQIAHCSYVTTSAISNIEIRASQSLTAGTVTIYGVK